MFVQTYTYLTLQGYYYILLILKFCKEKSWREFYHDCQLLLCHHGLVSDFANVVNAAMMFIGHTTCLALWIGIRGWGTVPAPLILILTCCAVVIVLFVVAITTSCGKIQQLSSEILREKVFSARLGNLGAKEVTSRQGKALRLIVLKSGSMIPETRSSALCFLQTLTTNLANSLIAFE